MGVIEKTAQLAEGIAWMKAGDKNKEQNREQKVLVG